MKKTIFLAFIILATLASSALADVKIKVKQTISGQTTENTTYIKGKRTRSEMMGGVMVTVTQCDLSRDLQLNPQMKTYVVSPYTDASDANGGSGTPLAVGPEEKGGTMTVTTTIRDTGERKQMFGFTARHIIQTIETESSPDACNPTKTKMEMDMWVIDAEFGSGCTQNSPYRQYKNGRSAGCTDKIVSKTNGSAKSGYPLWQKMTMFDANGKESFATTSEVVEMSKATLDASLFDVPADYREVKDQSQLYTSASAASGINYNGPSTNASASVPSTSSGLSTSIKNASTPRNDAPANVGAKRAGTIRLGLAGVKTGAVGEGISAADLSAAIQNSLGEFLKGTKVEIVPLEAKLASAQADEAKQKECDFIIVAVASHKKGGGGFGFGKMLGQVVGQTGLGATGSTIGHIAAGMATTAIVTAANLSGNVKSKDELTLDLKLVSTADNSSPLTKQFKAKARSDGDDIISTVVEQAAQAIIDAVGK